MLGVRFFGSSLCVLWREMLISGPNLFHKVFKYFIFYNEFSIRPNRRGVLLKMMCQFTFQNFQRVSVNLADVLDSVCIFCGGKCSKGSSQ